MKNAIGFLYFCFLSSAVIAADKPVDAAGVAAMGKVINSVPENNCAPTKAIYKGEISGRVYILTYCQSGASYAVHFLPDGTDTQVTDCAVVNICDELNSAQ